MVFMEALLTRTTMANIEKSNSRYGLEGCGAHVPEVTAMSDRSLAI